MAVHSVILRLLFLDLARFRDHVVFRSANLGELLVLEVRMLDWTLCPWNCLDTNLCHEHLTNVL